MTVLRKNTYATVMTDDMLQYVMSDGTKDRYGDIVEASGWDLEEFKQNPVALANHDPSFVVGQWVDVHVAGSKLLGRLKMAALGTSARIDELRRLVLAGILKACSVGFLPIEATPIPGGMRYKKQRLVECSIVATPANPAALRTEAKLLGVSDSMITKLIDRPPVNGSLAQRQEHARVMVTHTKPKTAIVPIEAPAAKLARLQAAFRAANEVSKRAKPLPGYVNSLADWERYNATLPARDKAYRAWREEYRKQNPPTARTVQLIADAELKRYQYSEEYWRDLELRNMFKGTGLFED